MRAALCIGLLFAGLALLVPASPAESPARARADAALVRGTLGDFGDVTANGDVERRDELLVEAEGGVVVGAGEVIARASRAGGKGTARAVAEARRIDLLDGLVTAELARRTATAAAGEVVYTGRVRGLTIGDRELGDVETTKTYRFDGGSVVVNRGTTSLLLRRGGTTIRVATAEASAADQVIPTPTPTAEPRKRKAAKAEAKVRRAPKVPQRLTSQRFAFPVYGRATVADDFGAERQIGAHQGNDVFAPFGAPVLAVADGVVEKVGTLAISGNRLWLRTKAGDEFFYAHLSAFSPDAVDGRHVKAGTVLGFTGNTGDAEPTPPHVHFEIHPGGTDAIDPHAILLAWQQDRDVPPGAWLTRYGEDTDERPGALVEVRDFIAGD
jgi:murein DD-endopeptidase MepM/ murein hydrolase activator NlpD